MSNSSSLNGAQHYKVGIEHISSSRKSAGKGLIIVASLSLAIILLFQILYKSDLIAFGFDSWRAVLYTYLIWAAALAYGQVLVRGELGKRALFLLPALLFTISMVIFPTFFGFFVAFSDWNLSSFEGRQFNGLDNIRTLWNDVYYWNALMNTVYYLLMVVVEFVIAFGLAVLLNTEIKARKFFRVAFLMPFMLSPVAVSWMLGKSLMEYRFGPAATLARYLGWETPAFFSTPWTAKISMEVMDGWMFIPFMMILILAGLQAIPKDILEAAKIDGASSWQTFLKIIFPIMIPVSITVLMLRIIFKFKLADIVINVTSGGPGGATDTVTSYIYRVYRERSNVGYGTMLAEVYLILIIIFMLTFLSLVNRLRKKVK
ncbi:MAG: sugar ABC transporter permease [Deltaproteobacteria bacterium]|jgi:multiple sugar transport system permease protein|nr:sugar ABC transporter permease [Deltaproteobacteria bacterium]